MTDELFREDAYLKSVEATVTAVTVRGGLVLDRTIFCPNGGGQPGDRGTIRRVEGGTHTIATTVMDRDGDGLVHVLERGAGEFSAGELVHCELDWTQRYAFMRTHTALHLLCSIIPHPVTGGQIDALKGRLDFNIAEPNLDKAALGASLNQLINDDRPVTQSWITDEELDANPDLVRTMSVKPPRGSGRIRMIRIADCDYQPCGGTHVASTAEIGSAEVTKIENKGAQNRRVRIQISS